MGYQACLRIRGVPGQMGRFLVGVLGWDREEGEREE